MIFHVLCTIIFLQILIGGIIMANLQALKDSITSLVASNEAERLMMVKLLTDTNAMIARLLALIAAGASIPQEEIDKINAVAQENTDALAAMTSADAEVNVEGQ
jgi:hypothetical protein